MLKFDLGAARSIWIEEAKTKKERESREKSYFLKYVDSGGRFTDFHCLRHTFITNLARANVSPKTAQTLARHCDIRLTMEKGLGAYSGCPRSIQPSGSRLSMQPFRRVSVSGDTNCRSSAARPWLRPFRDRRSCRSWRCRRSGHWRQSPCSAGWCKRLRHRPRERGTLSGR